MSEYVVYMFVLLFQNLNDVSLEGDITVPGAPAEPDEEEEFSTLDEPVRETIVSHIKKFLQGQIKDFYVGSLFCMRRFILRER